jgi:hypothetical protein
MQVQTHKQVKLHRNNERDTRWIPSEFAHEGRTVDLKNGGEWSRGWIVKEVFDPAVESKYIQEQSQNYKNHRKATDV